MKNLILYVKNMRKDLAAIFIVAVSTVILIDFVVKDPPKILQVIDKLCMSFMSAYIFYLLVVYMKEYKDRKNLYPYLREKVGIITGCCHTMIAELAREAGVDIKGTYPTNEEIARICTSVDPHGNAPLVVGMHENHFIYANWFQYFEFVMRRSNEATEKIYRKMPFLKSDMITLLTEVEDCLFFTVVNHVIRSWPISNKNLDAFAGNIGVYIHAVKKLDRYAAKHFTDYGKE